MQLIDSLPLWSVFLAVVLGTLLCVEAGFICGKGLRGKCTGESEAPIGAMVGGVLALVAFMLSFTFGMASTRFEERRHLVLEEANALGTTYLRSEFLNEPARTDFKKLLRQYVAVQLDSAAHPEHWQEAAQRTECLQGQLWTQAVELGRNHPSPISGLLVSSLNDVIDLHAKRVAAIVYTRVPGVVWAGLLFITALAMAGVGHYSGRTGTRAWTEILTLICATGTVLVLVADLDRPCQGLLQVSELPMTELARQIGAIY